MSKGETQTQFRRRAERVLGGIRYREIPIETFGGGVSVETGLTCLPGTIVCRRGSVLICEADQAHHLQGVEYPLESGATDDSGDLIGPKSFVRCLMAD